MSAAAASVSSVTADVANLTLGSSDGKTVPDTGKKAGFIFFMGPRRYGTSTQATALHRAMNNSLLLDYKSLSDRKTNNEYINQQVVAGNVVILDVYLSGMDFKTDYAWLDDIPGMVICLYNDENSLVGMGPFNDRTVEFVSRQGTVPEVHERVLKAIKKHGF